MAEYERTRTKRGVRPRLEAMVEEFAKGSALETNICALPTKKATQLKRRDRCTEAFLFLLRSIQPQLLFLYSNEPINYIRALLDDPALELPDHVPVRAALLGTTATICVSRGPLWRRKKEEMADLARQLASDLR